MSALDDVLFAYAMFVLENPKANEKLFDARLELAALHAPRERVESELTAARDLAGVIDGVSLADWLREELANHADCHAERDALRNNVVCRFCGASYPIGAEEPDHWRTCKESPIARMIDDLETKLKTVTAERDAAHVELESAKTYQRMAARR